MGEGEGSWGAGRGVGWLDGWGVCVGEGGVRGGGGCGGVGKRNRNLEESKNAIHLTKLFPGRQESFLCEERGGRGDSFSIYYSFRINEQSEITNFKGHTHSCLRKGVFSALKCVKSSVSSAKAWEESRVGPAVRR